MNEDAGKRADFLANAYRARRDSIRKEREVKQVRSKLRWDADEARRAEQESQFQTHMGVLKAIAATAGINEPDII